MTLSIRKAPSYDEFEKGTWFRTLLDETGQKTVWFRCANGHYGTLGNHDIAADGTVTPSVVCPEQGCVFHDTVKLEGWMDLT